MCCGVRCTDSRVMRSSRILARDLTARCRRWAFLFMSNSRSDARSLLLRFLQLDLLARIAHAFALVRLRRAEVADVGGDLADLLYVRALDDDFGLARRFDRDALGRGGGERVGGTETR